MPRNTGGNGSVSSENSKRKNSEFLQDDNDASTTSLPISSTKKSRHDLEDEKKEEEIVVIVRTGDTDNNDVILQHQKDNHKTKIPDRESNTESSNKHGIFHAYMRSLFTIDHTQIALVPAMRTALIMMIEMSIFGVGNARSTFFRVAALYVGFSDPSGSLSLRLQYMGTTLITVIIMGALLPGLTWDSPGATIGTAFALSILTGLSPAVGSHSLVLAMKLGLALFAINGGVNRSTNGFKGVGYSVLWTFYGSSASLLAALLPEIIGNRDAIRTSLFKVWHGFGVNLHRWGNQWGTYLHLDAQPVPRVTLSVTVTKAIILDNHAEERVAKEWLLRIMENAETIRVASLCLSNVYKLTSCYNGREDSEQIDNEVDAFFLAVGRSCSHTSFALQFPWLIRYVPLLKDWVRGATNSVDEAATALLLANKRVEESNEDSICWLPSIVEVIRSEVQSISELVLDENTWPPYSPLRSLPRRINATFPSTCPKLIEDRSWRIRGYAMRLAIAFTLATIPELFKTETSHAHWFPMTVALIMGPSHGETYVKVTQRVIGTLLGLGLGAAMSPLLDIKSAILILLTLNTYASVLFFTANYSAFTFFVTGWVYVTIVGAGAAVGYTTLYRCGWTLAAGALVIFIMCACPSRAQDVVGNKLAILAKTTGLYTEAVVEEINLCSDGWKQTEENRAAVKAVKEKVARTEIAVKEARVALVTYINEAALSPAEGHHIDPCSVALGLAADLLNAVVIPRSVSLVADGSANGLLSDVDEEALSELNRLVKRLEEHGDLVASSRSTVIEKTALAGRGPFSNAIASAHRRLDEAEVPSKTTY